MTVEDASPTLEIFLKEAGKRTLPSHLKPSHELDEFTLQLLSSSLTGQTNTLATCKSLFQTPGKEISVFQ
jgi:hypothetical protein